MERNKEIMEESIREFNEIYSDFGYETLNEDINETTISADEFHTSWHQILEEVYQETYGNS